jgi:hypothetical protein
MSELLLDEQMRRKLNGLKEPLAVKDEAGVTVGQFLPQRLYRSLLEASAGRFNALTASDEEFLRQTEIAAAEGASQDDLFRDIDQMVEARKARHERLAG